MQMWRVRQLAFFLSLLALGGCEGMFGGHGLPPDPLFANRKPIEAKATTGPPTLPPFTEPTAPANPYAVDP